MNHYAKLLFFFSSLNATNQEGRRALGFFPKVVRPQLEVAEPLPGILGKLAHPSVGVRGQGSRP